MTSSSNFLILLSVSFSKNEGAREGVTAAAGVEEEPEIATGGDCCEVVS